MVDVPDDAQAALGPDLGARVAELEAARAGLEAERAALRQELATAKDRRSRVRRGRYDGGTLTAYAGCVTPKSATHDALLAHGTSGGSLGRPEMCPKRIRRCSKQRCDDVSQLLEAVRPRLVVDMPTTSSTPRPAEIASPPRYGARYAGTARAGRGP